MSRRVLPDPVTSTSRAGARAVPGTGMPVWLALSLVACGLPRTVLADLGIVAPESSWIYYVLALAPFAAWAAVAAFRRTGRPFRDHLLVGTLYGLSLVVVHELLWTTAASLGSHPTQGAVELAARFAPGVRDLVLHGYSAAIAMAIGLGAGLVAGGVAAVANRVRPDRSR